MPAGCDTLRPKAMMRLKFSTAVPIAPTAAISSGFSNMHRYLAAALLALLSTAAVATITAFPASFHT
jgi:hypothetical protein